MIYLALSGHESAERRNIGPEERVNDDGLNVNVPKRPERCVLDGVVHIGAVVDGKPSEVLLAFSPNEYHAPEANELNMPYKNVREIY